MEQVEDTPKIDWNELILVSKHQGQTQVWSAWKNAISVFADPQMWESTEKWGQHFKPHPGKSYGIEGYGIIVMDLDSRQCWSINDYTSPESIHLPLAHQLKEKDQTGFLKALEVLLGRPDQWENVEFTVSPEPGKNTYPQMKLSEIADPSVSPKVNLKNLAAVRGEIQIKDQPRMVLSGKYIPQGWRVSSTREREDLDVLEECLLAMQSLDFPPPGRQSIMSFVQDKAPHMEEENVLAEDIVQRFEAILDGWTGLPASKTPKP